MKNFLFMAMMFITLVACNTDEFCDLSTNETEQEKVSFVVTPEEAVNRLQMFLSKNGTRVSLNKFAITTLRKSDFVPATRSADADADNPAVYLIDIPDGGCAVMGADKRLEPVYAIMDETKLSPEDLVATSTRTESTEEDIQTFVTGLINDAIEADLMGIPIIKDTTELIPNPLPYGEFWTDTTVYCRVQPLLKTKWHQDAPFNNNYPSINGTKKYAGCGVIATAQLVYYNRQPSNYNGVFFDWNLISQYEYPHTQSYSADIAIANFTFSLANGVGATYNNLNELPTATYTNGIQNFFQNNGYNNASFNTYSLSGITYLLALTKPVLTYGQPSYTTMGHYWIIDGCNVFKLDHWVKKFKYPVAIGEEAYEEYIYDTENYNLLHCNYGWGGSCDGYYTTGIFETRIKLTSEYIDSTIGDIADTNEDLYDTNLLILNY